VFYGLEGSKHAAGGSSTPTTFRSEGALSNAIPIAQGRFRRVQIGLKNNAGSWGSVLFVWFMHCIFFRALAGRVQKRPPHLPPERRKGTPAPGTCVVVLDLVGPGHTALGPVVRF
jgi:hypothetical protein